MRWILPQTRPNGWRTALLLGHWAWLVAAVVIAVILTWNDFGGVVRWVFVGLLVYGVVSIPWLLWMFLRTRWNAPEAERRNREVLTAR